MQVVFDPIIMLSNAAAAFGLNMSVFLLIGKVRPVCHSDRACLRSIITLRICLAFRQRWLPLRATYCLTARTETACHPPL